MKSGPTSSAVTAVKATDLGEGINKEVKYSCRKITVTVSQIFHMDERKNNYKKFTQYEILDHARDGRDLTDTSAVVIIVTDLIDHIPKSATDSHVASLPEASPKGTEDSLEGTLVALFNVKDQGSASNGESTCSSYPLFRSRKSYNQFDAGHRG